jgi:hypothetical protein
MNANARIRSEAGYLLVKWISSAPLARGFAADHKDLTTTHVHTMCFLFTFRTSIWLYKQALDAVTHKPRFRLGSSAVAISYRRVDGLASGTFSKTECCPWVGTLGTSDINYY